MSADRRIVARGRGHDLAALPTPVEADENGIPAPAARGPLGWARAYANQAFTETVEPTNGHGNGHGPNGHEAIEGGEHAAIGAGDDDSHEEH